MKGEKALESALDRGLKGLWPRRWLLLWLKKNFSGGTAPDEARIEDLSLKMQLEEHSRKRNGRF